MESAFSCMKNHGGDDLSEGLIFNMIVWSVLAIPGYFYRFMIQFNRLNEAHRWCFPPIKGRILLLLGVLYAMWITILLIDVSFKKIGLVIVSAVIVICYLFMAEMIMARAKAITRLTID